MARVMTAVPIKELVELRHAKLAHDDFLEALTRLRESAFRVIRERGADADYTKGYWAALGDISTVVASKPVSRKEDDLPW